MKVTVEVTQAELAEMGVSVEQLESAVKEEMESGLEIDGDTLYINDADVSVMVAQPPFDKGNYHHGKARSCGAA